MEEIIINYLCGRATEEEIKELQNWLSLGEENKRTYDEIADIWNGTVRVNKQKFDAKAALGKVQLITRKKNNKVFVQSSNQAKSDKFYAYANKIAAFFIIALLIGNLILFQQYKSITISNKNIYTEIVAPVGSKSNITLPDGTQVWLNSGSKIKFGALFNKSDRNVIIEGEAYFDVIKNKKMPFLVITPDVTIRVLGTAFNVKAYPDEGSIETTLVRGSLIVEQKTDASKTSQTILAPNQRATFVKKSGKLYLSDIENQVLKKDKIDRIEKLKGKVLVSKQIDTDVFTAWKDNRLVFRNESFKSLAVKLERWYGVKITIVDIEIEEYHFNGTIENETINDVMEIIKYALPINYTIQHNNIIIKK
jgi:ferric-dicitrate binding protein FerR (iron transport regulator)